MGNGLARLIPPPSPLSLSLLTPTPTLPSLPIQIDVCSIEEVEALARAPASIPISASARLNLDALLGAMWDGMALRRVYTKKVGSRPDFDDPVVLSADRGGVTVRHLCDRIHRHLAPDLAYALVWGTSAKHYPQRAGLGHQLEDEDVVQIVKRKVGAGEAVEGKGRFKSTSSKPDRIADREKKPALRS
jgi:hypothetical protein